MGQQLETQISIKGSYDNGQEKTIVADIYNLEAFLLTGKKISCLLSPTKLGIGASALPRRILDCRKYLGMIIEPQDPNAPKKPHIRADGKKTSVREYYMTSENIEKYIKDRPAKAKYPTKFKQTKNK